jgi:hypothetical protein
MPDTVLFEHRYNLTVVFPNTLELTVDLKYRIQIIYLKRYAGTSMVTTANLTKDLMTTNNSNSGSKLCATSRRIKMNLQKNRVLH